ncbi:TetR/AcrR family transcriptional regulator [Roseovarius sp.]|uniref:TetR/AcrR family transcriptional regulator n=1 Tax=Roseovarius sp. TaxID=1486281 RepID=UPI003BABF7EE
MARKRRPPEPRKGAARDLTREKVIGAALETLDRDGFEALSMRSLANRLGVTPMALYNHVNGKQDLLRAIATHVLGTADFDRQEAHWRNRVEACFRQIRALCRRHPSLPRLLETAGVAPAEVFAPMETSLRALREAGLNDLDALRTYFTLISFTLGQTSYETRGPFPGLEVSGQPRDGSLAGHGFTAVEQAKFPDTWDFDAAFEFGLRLILDGVGQAAADGDSPRSGKP